jgi:hypothetical protein
MCPAKPFLISLHLCQNYVATMQQGRTTPRDLAMYFWNLAGSSGERLIKGGKGIESEQDNIAELVLAPIHAVVKHPAPLPCPRGLDLDDVHDRL